MLCNRKTGGDELCPEHRAQRIREHQEEARTAEQAALARRATQEQLAARLSSVDGVLGYLTSELLGEFERAIAGEGNERQTGRVVKTANAIIAATRLRVDARLRFRGSLIFGEAQE